MAHLEFECAVQVQPLGDQLPQQDHAPVYAYSYTIVITNKGDTAAQLVAREWTITDARGEVQEVRGLAVVGHQPLLQPGESFRYSSWAQIATPQGSMRGRYLCVSETAEVFYADIPEFMLADTSQLH